LKTPEEKPQELKMVEPEVVQDDSFEKAAEALKAEVFAEGVLKNHKNLKGKDSVKNLVKGRYTVSDANYVWCSDWTIGQGGTLYILLILDMSSKLIISSSILDREPKGSDIVLTLLKGINTYGETPKVFHTDCGGAYMSKELANFLKEKKIQHSHRDKSDSHFDNQVIENLNRKLWDTLQRTGWLDSQTKRKRFIAAQHDDINYVLNSVIEKINLDKPGNWNEGNRQNRFNRPRRTNLSKKYLIGKKHLCFFLRTKQRESFLETFKSQTSNPNSLFAEFFIILDDGEVTTEILNKALKIK
jgi:transposase InsO family protein